MLIMGGRTNDNEHPKVALLKQRLRAGEQMHLLYDVIHVLAAKYQAGRQWKADTGATHLGPIVPQQFTGTNPKVTANIIAPQVRHLDGRLKVDDFRGHFIPNDGRPETHLTTRQLQSWYNKWVGHSRIGPWYHDLSFARVVLGTQVGSWYFDDSAPGGIRLARMFPARLTLDPAETTAELDGHEYVVDSEAMSTAAAERSLGHYMAKKGISIKSQTPLTDLRTSEVYLGRDLYNLQPGSLQSETTGVVVHRMYDHWFGHLTVIVQNPSPERAKDDDSWDHDWHVIYDDDWLYGCPFLKLDLFKSIATALGTGLVVELVPMQDLINLAMRAELRGFIARASFKYFAVKDSIINPDVLRSNQEGAVVWVKPTARDRDFWPQQVQMNKLDTSSMALIQQALSFGELGSGVTPTMRGEGIKRGQAFAAYELLRQQSSVPLQTIARQDKERTDTFSNGVARAGVERMARTRPKAFVDFVGIGLANRTLAKIASKRVLEGPSRCSLRDNAFLPQTTEEKETRLFALAEAGRFPFMEFVQELFQQTGRPVLEGQIEAYQQASEIARRKVLGIEVKIRLYDNHTVIQRVVRQLLNQRLTAEYDDDVLQRLEDTIIESKDMEFTQARMDAARQQLSSPSTGGEVPLSSEGMPGAPPPEGQEGEVAEVAAGGEPQAA